MSRNGTITIRDVAREAQVSVATVSRALNGHDNVAEEVRKLVLETARRLRYQPHAAARSLSSRSTQTIGVVLPDLYGEFFSELIRGIDGVAREHRRHLLVSSYHGAQDAQGAALRAMRGRVDGLLVLSPYADQPGFLTDNLPDGLPVVLINTHLPHGDYPVLNIDNHGGAVAMMRHLVASGRRRIAFIAGPACNFDAAERLRGYRDALAELLPGVAEQVLPGRFDEASGMEAGTALLAAGSRPDAVFAANDTMALGCLFAFNQAGVRVPQDIALAGFDDVPVARFVHPPLTTMRISIAELGANALRRLLQDIQAKAPLALPDPAPLVPELVVRDSAPAAAAL
ncbi:MULTISPECIES: LacI family DNA-binding transcriptional regulator [Pseudoxanthomonas]|jgi:LacI family transcriptional regulator|uniref:LacI family transcriptional regulator n=1 Tax=Pseudoxanthomonas winnipegensis TaxID=2480810 RepID=A0A4Q8LZF3_9GAMM|nr:LacI family DNA-binding transcriptional regulator [Pseudoxanthomonas winnipegensis]RZZ86897.1 LacI family transcriptional regulator [Pseudoxanthomonas winnipegensis]RZZ87497.1 LacI family transcriptional regulator [Pseudoxanthomonas winnipegensis]TAA07250.1 LacI family transcriptional regulator [Pseudoxanthomonas winnipegensis]TAA20891.1 LacI family transcriptional regulator [Pseudoxanthomonas winnipegensis]TAA29634.1 LacI family transcriptional regulator [Pseudoxanthomonas winnipegensis]